MMNIIAHSYGGFYMQIMALYIIQITHNHD